MRRSLLARVWGLAVIAVAGQAAASSSSTVLSTAGSIASLVAAVGIVFAVANWLWRWSRRHAFPNLLIEVTGLGYHTVEREMTAVGASNSLIGRVRLRRVQVTIVSREPDRNSALTFTLQFRDKAGKEVPWATPQWRLDPTKVDEHLDLLVSPVNVEREHTVSGVLLFAPSQFPVDESVAPKMEVFDHVSRACVRFPANELRNFDAKTWERGSERSRIGRLYRRLLERDERYAREKGAER